MIKFVKKAVRGYINSYKEMVAIAAQSGVFFRI